MGDTLALKDSLKAVGMEMDVFNKLTATQVEELAEAVVPIKKLA